MIIKNSLKIKINNTLLYSYLILFFSAINAEVLLKPDDTIKQLNDLSLEDLMNVEVASVTRKKKKLSDSAAADYHIDSDSIDTNTVDYINTSPEHQFQLHYYWDLDNQHQEFSEFSGLSTTGSQGMISTEVERNIHLKLIWQF